MISTVVSARKCFGPRAWAIVGAIAVLVCGGRNALAVQRSNRWVPGA